MAEPAATADLHPDATAVGAGLPVVHAGAKAPTPELEARPVVTSQGTQSVRGDGAPETPDTPPNQKTEDPAVPNLASPAATTTSSPGLVSPDGNYNWDGTKWVPSSPTRIYAKKPNSKKVGLGIAGVVLVALMGGGLLLITGSRGGIGAKHTLTGTMAVYQEPNGPTEGRCTQSYPPGGTILNSIPTMTCLGPVAGSTCTGASGFSDMQAGAPVVVKDQAGSVVATGSLGGGGWEGTGTYDCKFSFTVASVPDANFYQVEIGHRGAQTYKASDLNSTGWNISLTLGP